MHQNGENDGVAPRNHDQVIAKGHVAWNETGATTARLGAL